ncbi:MAG: PKD domain-containing protein, partial [Acidobacteriota bacterium]
TLEDGTDAVQLGELVTYTLTVSNAGSFDRSGVLLTSASPAGTSVDSASDGGSALAGGVVTWPAFSLAAGESAVRTLTLRVDPALPLSVTTLTNTAEVTDDGAAGPDPTPDNNRASDTNRVSTVRADAGGPYSGEEGTPIAFDASSSSDRDGTVVAYAWDFDGDGDFTDAAGVTASFAFPDDGVFTVAVRVTDDSGEQDTATAQVTVANLAPIAEAGPDLVRTEGDSVVLTASFIDAGAADTHTATIDWGDGSPPEAGVVDPAGRTVTGGRAFPDDGVFTVTVCVSDDDGATACDSAAVTIENADPLVIEPFEVDLNTWTAENLEASGSWTVSADGQDVDQLVNSDPTVFFGPFTAIGSGLEGGIEVRTGGDDDFVGFVLGFQPGDFENPSADYLLVDWKQRDQTAFGGFGPAGLAISRVRGIPTFGEMWGHEDEDGDGQGVLELQRGRTLGATGWADRTRYVFTFQTTPDRVQVRVNGVLELDVRGDFSFGSGRFGFYNFSQEFVRYSAFSSQGLTFFEGEPATISLPFSDVGVLDTHTATIDWRDGTVEPGTVVSGDGGGLVSGAHAYLDDGAQEIEICVTDDDGGEDCGAFPATVINVDPSFSVGPDRLAYVGEGLAVEVPFTDPGTADTHTATIDWGDGIAEAATVAGGAGSGTVTGSHDYAAEGTYTVEVCVTDDDGGSRCDTFEVTWLEPLLDFSMTKTASLEAVRPGETLVYGLTVDNLGTREPQNLIVRDALPSGLDFIAASAGGVFDAATRTVTWTLPRLDFESSVELRLITSAPANSAAFGTPLVNTASVEDDGRFGPDLDPSNNLSTAESVAWDGMTPRVGAVTQALRLEENEDLSILARFDDPYLATEPPAIPVTGLVGEWSFDQASDPLLGTGPSRYPARLGSVPGADPNDPAYACAVGIAPVAGNLCALELTGRSTDATDDFVSVANEPALDFTAAYTLSGWVRWDSAVNDHRPIFIRGAADGTTNANDLEVYIQRNSRDLVVYHNRGNGGSARFVTFRDPPRDQLFHLAVTYDGARVRVYYDGVEQGSGSLVPALATGRDWMFGKVDHSAFGGGRTRYFDGLIDEVRFYDRALGVSEVESLAARSGLGEAHTATIDWGDGTVEAGVLNDPLGGSISGTHRYLDDYAGDIEICVTDAAANVGCGRIPVEVENVAPSVSDDSDIDLRLWQAEGFGDEFDWEVAADGSSVLQRINGPPTFFYGDFTSFDTNIEGTIEVQTSGDDDFIVACLIFSDHPKLEDGLISV